MPTEIFKLFSVVILGKMAPPDMTTISLSYGWGRQRKKILAVELKKAKNGKYNVDAL